MIHKKGTPSCDEVPFKGQNFFMVFQGKSLKSFLNTFMESLTMMFLA